MRVILVILDSVGIGEMPDAPLYGDTGSNTLANIARSVNGLRMPNMQKLGLGNIYPIQGVFPVQASLGAYGKLKEFNDGKDTTTGHWEMSGIYLEKPFDFFPNGFDSHIINEFELRTNRKVIGNTVASGTKIIQDLGPEQEKTGSWIVYTSADSVFQVAAHEEIIPLEELYHGCKIAHEMFTEMGYNIGRIIARPYIGKYPEYIRTSNRKDISSPPPAETVLDVLTGSGIKVYAVGKIHDIFAERGISEYVKTVDNIDGIEKTLLYMKE
ncbi:MAG TPA: phosphopentomutase, partial [Petrotogaceae bacterium]|nr:phosphopentomutase [Petrotogaceae bacterium]